MSARRDLDDAEMLNILDRCYRLLQGRRDSTCKPGTAKPGEQSPIATSLLAKHLKRPVYEATKRRLTALDHNLYDIIWPSVKKLPPNVHAPIYFDFPLGIAAPDHLAYAVFQELFTPLLKEAHCLDAASEISQPPPAYLAAADGSDQYFDYDLDSSGKWITSGAIEITRNLDYYHFPRCLTIGQLEEVERELTIELMKPDLMIRETDEDTGEAGYYTLNEVLDEGSYIRAWLEVNGLMIPLYNLDDSERLHGHHWPYGRGVYINAHRDTAAWINVLDHLRVIVKTPAYKPGNIGDAYAKISRISFELGRRLSFKHGPALGFLSCRPSCVGNTLRFRLNVRLSHLGKQRAQLLKLCVVRGLTIGDDINGTSPLGNQQCLGVTEPQTFEDYATAVSNILQLEKDLAMHNSLHIAQLFVSIFRRKKSGLIANQ